MGRAGAAAVLFFLWFFSAISFPSLGLSAELSPACKSEINHLLTYIEQCDCQFNRNGTWYKDTKVVRGHVELKYGYFEKKGRIASAEDFITWSASKSEISGKPYMVKCGNASAQPLAAWLSDELERYRKEN